MIQKTYKRSLKRVKPASILVACLLVFILISLDSSYGQTITDNNTKFLQAVSLGDSKKVRELLENGADVNAKDASGKTALMLMADRGDIEKAKVLLEFGADINDIDEEFKEILVNGKEIPQDFHGWWVNESLYNDYVSKVSPIRARRKGQFSALGFTERFKVFVSTFHEGWYQNVWVKDEIEVSILKPAPRDVQYSVKLVRTPTDLKLKLIDENADVFEFIKYPVRFSQRPPNELLNELFFAGKYFVNDASKREVSFEVGGTVTGMEGYVGYAIGHGGPPYFDWMHLLTENPREYGIYHWTVSGDTLSLFNLVDDREEMFKIDTLFLQLIKISK